MFDGLTRRCKKKDIFMYTFIYQKICHTSARRISTSSEWVRERAEILQGKTTGVLEDGTISDRKME